MANRFTLEFLKTEAASGMILAVSAAAAVILANSPWSVAYFGFIDAPIAVQLGAFRETHSVLDWVKEGLMAVFFLIVGLEIKYEVLRGELSHPRRLALPVLAAVGGMAVPALIYLLVNLGPGGHPQGWPVPTATDIAFAAGALAIAGPRLSPSLRLFLLTLAIADDLGAVALIAILFSHGLDMEMLAGALTVLVALALMSRWRQAPLLLYALGFLLVWGFTLKSGVSTSLAGVACALTVPVAARRAGGDSMLHVFMHALHPYVAFFILPLFAFSAAGFSFSGLSAGDLIGPVPLGVALGLVLGKAIGVFGAVGLAIATKLGRRPTGATWLELFGVSILCGVGFTMSLFIGALAFPDGHVAQSGVRLGVLAGSALAALIGGGLLAWSQARRERSP